MQVLILMIMILIQNLEIQILIIGFFVVIFIIYSHGTRCAGEAVATANNGICGVGVAFGAKVGGYLYLTNFIKYRN